MIIGNFNYNKAQDTYTGEIATLSGATRKVVFKPSEATGDKVPQYRVLGPSKAGDIEFGAAWKKRTDEGRDYSRSSSTIRRCRRRSTARW